MKWTCTIPNYFPPSLNKIKRMHWREQERVDRVAHGHVCIELVADGNRTPCFVGRVSVRITRRYSGSKKAMDEDNLNAAVKPLIDALRRPRGRETKRRLGIIEDDTPALMDLDVKQERADVTETIIEVESA